MENNLYKKRIDSIIKKLERCSKEDCDFYLEHNETIEFYEYIKELMLSEKARKKAIKYIKDTRIIINGFRHGKTFLTEIFNDYRNKILEILDKGE